MNTASAITSVLERPRLRRGVRLFDDGRGLIVRSSKGAYRVTPDQRDLMPRILANLDGTHEFDELLGRENADDAFYALHILDVWAQAGLLAEGPWVAPGGLQPATLPAVRLDGTTLIFPISGSFAEALSDRLEGL